MTKESTPITKRQQQAIATKNLIYSTALRLFGRYEYEDVKISDICEAAGVSVGSFYNYFSSKEELILSTVESFDNEIVSVWTAVRESDCSTIDKLCEILILPAKSASASPPNQNATFLRVILKTHSDVYLNNMRTLDKYVNILIREAFHTKELESTEAPSDVANSIMRVVRGLVYDWTIRNGPYDLVAETRKAIFHFLKPYISCTD